MVTHFNYIFWFILSTDEVYIDEDDIEYFEETVENDVDNDGKGLHVLESAYIL